VTALRVVLFDLDGTLVDSAPDLTGTVNDMRVVRGLEPLPYAALRHGCGSGARGMLALGLQRQPADADYESLRQEFLALYAQRLLRHTALFDTVPPMLAALEAAGLRWGIVTNKARHLAQALVQALSPLPGAATLVGGDCTPHTKPHPASLLEAARRLQVAPRHCVYVGDDLRDMQAARAAGMGALAAAWGYLGPGHDPADWAADAVLRTPAELWPHLQSRHLA
jgi:N-acetyl-D-muramate 6-phosphate phosphatase